MIFTIGHAKTYYNYMEEYGSAAMKAGRDPESGDEGGTVFQTYDDAVKCCPEDYHVFGVYADWQDTAPRPPGEWGRELLRNARLVRLSRMLHLLPQNICSILKSSRQGSTQDAHDWLEMGEDAVCVFDQNNPWRAKCEDDILMFAAQPDPKHWLLVAGKQARWKGWSTTLSPSAWLNLDAATKIRLPAI